MQKSKEESTKLEREIKFCGKPHSAERKEIRTILGAVEW